MYSEYRYWGISIFGCWALLGVHAFRQFKRRGRGKKLGFERRTEGSKSASREGPQLQSPQGAPPTHRAAHHSCHSGAHPGAEMDSRHGRLVALELQNFKRCVSAIRRSGAPSQRTACLSGSQRPPCFPRAAMRAPRPSDLSSVSPPSSVQTAPARATSWTPSPLSSAVRSRSAYPPIHSPLPDAALLLARVRPNSKNYAAAREAAARSDFS